MCIHVSVLHWRETERDGKKGKWKKEGKHKSKYLGSLSHNILGHNIPSRCIQNFKILDTMVLEKSLTKISLFISLE